MEVLERSFQAFPKSRTKVGLKGTFCVESHCEMSYLTILFIRQNKTSSPSSPFAWRPIGSSDDFAIC